MIPEGPTSNFEIIMLSRRFYISIIEKRLVSIIMAQEDINKVRDREYRKAGLNLIKEGEHFVLPIEIPAKVEGVHGKVPFNGNGIIRIEGFTDDTAARRAGFPEWRIPGKNIPNIFTFVDDKAGPLVRIVPGNDMLGWHRAQKAGRLAKRTGVNIVWDVNELSGWAFFEAGKNNWLLEYALNKIMGWNLFDEEEAWSLLTADTLAMEWPKEQMMKINLREHFFKNPTNKLMLFRRARGRMEQDPALPLPELVGGGGAPERYWVSRYVFASSAIERHVIRHPELANLYPEWTADALATKYVRMMQKINYVPDALEAHLENQVFLADVVGNLIGLGECIDKTEPFLVLSYEHAVEGLQAFRTDRIDSPSWLNHAGGVEHINKCIEWTELLLAGKWEDAAKVEREMYETFEKYLKNGAKDTGKDFMMLWIERLPIMLMWDVLQAYVGESVRRGIWKPVNVTPLRVNASPA
ncbi:hypothetical protein NTE_03372 [Candidatus Nitrososphaera evergladensis SR1]|uniref:Uncharacterized protein n=2 Tax=Nitrososphaera TaxID=497726 RepID=A0A075MVW8_9ARCH|nr:hypothetical protein NTE_03372 [Candidatus Nitrososphaera evergladensis SR1]